MSLIFKALYFVLFLGFLLTSLFILYHIARYSLSKKSSFLMAMIFAIGVTVLLITNLILFLSIDFNSFMVFAL